jgi:hypothetical protein
MRRHVLRRASDVSEDVQKSKPSKKPVEVTLQPASPALFCLALCELHGVINQKTALFIIKDFIFVTEQLGRMRRKLNLEVSIL